MWKFGKNYKKSFLSEFFFDDSPFNFNLIVTNRSPKNICVKLSPKREYEGFEIVKIMPYLWFELLSKLKHVSRNNSILEFSCIRWIIQMTNFTFETS